MYGLISKINTVPGQRDALAEILVEGTRAMPGCLGYVIASDLADDNASGSLKYGTVRRVTGLHSRCLQSRQRSRQAGR